MNLCMVAHPWSTNIFGYDKLWGPSQGVDTLFYYILGGSYITPEVLLLVNPLAKKPVSHQNCDQGLP